MVLKLSLNAQKSLDDYVNQVKAYLNGVKSVDAEEIVQNINEHIESELTGSVEPVGSETLDKVLKKLGSPQQWVPGRLAVGISILWFVCNRFFVSTSVPFISSGQLYCISCRDVAVQL
jgi:hypothetical protein